MSEPAFGTSQDGHSQKRRKLALVKCERCRLDKQKCLPLERVWPEKCRRCIFKNFPCSEGQRVSRKTKHETATPASHSPVTDNPAPSEVSASSQFLQTLKSRRTLLAYQKIMHMAIRRLESLKEELIQPFIDDSERHKEFEKALRNSGYTQFLSFYELLEINIAEVTDILLAHKTPNLAVTLGTDIVHELIGQSSPSFIWTTECPICDKSYDDASISSLQRSKNLCGEYLARLSRVARHFEGKKHWEDNDSNNVYQLLAEERDAIHALIPQLQTEVANRLKDLNVLSQLPDMSMLNLHFIPDEVNRFTVGFSNHQTDCLGRTNLHQYMDAIDDSEMPSEPIFMHMLDTQGPDVIYRADILGRTTLHIACQKGWDRIAMRLMICGAIACKKTVCGSLPLHYAAARGSLRTCRELLRQPYPSNDFYDADGRHPLFYALRGGFPEVFDLFQEQNQSDFFLEVHIELGIRVNADSDVVRKFLSAYKGTYTQLRDRLLDKGVPVQPHHWTLINRYYGFEKEKVPFFHPLFPIRHD